MGKHRRFMTKRSGGNEIIGGNKCEGRKTERLSCEQLIIRPSPCFSVLHLERRGDES